MCLAKGLLPACRMGNMGGDRDRGLWELGPLLGLWEPVVLEIEDSWAGGGLEDGINQWECLISACEVDTVLMPIL